MRKFISAAACSAALFAGACTNSEFKPNHEGLASTTTITSQPDNTQELADKGIHEFRNNLSTQHIADIALGTCVAWPTDNNKITVTINPGLEQYNEGKRSLLMFVFSYTDKTKSPPEEILLNGAYDYTGDDGVHRGTMESEGVITLVKDPQTKSYSIHRHITDLPKQGPDGRWSYFDSDENIPVIKSTIANGPATQDHVLDVCDQMWPGYAPPAAPSIHTN